MLVGGPLNLGTPTLAPIPTVTLTIFVAILDFSPLHYNVRDK